MNKFTKMSNEAISQYIFEHGWEKAESEGLTQAVYNYKFFSAGVRLHSPHKNTKSRPDYINPIVSDYVRDNYIKLRDIFRIYFLKQTGTYANVDLDGKDIFHDVITESMIVISQGDVKESNILSYFRKVMFLQLQSALNKRSKDLRNNQKFMSLLKHEMAPRIKTKTKTSKK